MSKNGFVGELESKEEFCLRDTLAARSFYGQIDLQSWIEGSEVQDLSCCLREEVEEDASADA